MKCTSCLLSNWADPKYNASEGWGNADAKLVILLDQPGDTLCEKLLVWLLYRLTLTDKDVWIDYTLKCPFDKVKKAELQVCVSKCWTKYPRVDVLNRTLVVCGSHGTDLILQGKMKDLHGLRDTKTEAWVIYGMGYLLMNPNECVEAWRTLFMAAQEAGLKPAMNLQTPAFRFPSKKLR